MLRADQKWGFSPSWWPRWLNSLKIFWPFLLTNSYLLNQYSFTQRGHVPISNAECSAATLASVQSCHRVSGASVSRPTEWHSWGQPNSHLCIVCHAIAVQVLTCGTRLCFSIYHKHTVTCDHTTTHSTPSTWPWGHYICLTWRGVSCFLTPCPWEFLLLTDVSDGTMTFHAGSPHCIWLCVTLDHDSAILNWQKLLTLS